VIEWCLAYWIDSDFGQLSGPWTTLESALQTTRAGELREMPSMMMNLVGIGQPKEVTFNTDDVGRD